MLQGLSLAFSMGTYVGLLSHGVGGFVCATSYAAPSWRHVFYMGKLGAGFFFFFFWHLVSVFRIASVKLLVR